MKYFGSSAPVGWGGGGMGGTGAEGPKYEMSFSAFLSPQESNILGTPELSQPKVFSSHDPFKFISRPSIFGGNVT